MTAATVLTQPVMIRLRPRKPPAQRAYAPKATDGGQRVTWSREISGHWTGASWGEGTWVPGHTVTRSGEIWSDGPPDTPARPQPATAVKETTPYSAEPGGWAAALMPKGARKCADGHIYDGITHGDDCPRCRSGGGLGSVALPPAFARALMMGPRRG